MCIIIDSYVPPCLNNWIRLDARINLSKALVSCVTWQVLSISSQCGCTVDGYESYAALTIIDFIGIVKLLWLNTNVWAISKNTKYTYIKFSRIKGGGGGVFYCSVKKSMSIPKTWYISCKKILLSCNLVRSLS